MEMRAFSQKTEEVKTQRGTALVMALFILTVLTVVGTMVLNTSIVEIKMAQNQKISAQVFFAAESGLERGLLMHLKDFQDDNSPGSPWGNDTYASWAESVSSTPITSGSDVFNVDTRSLDMYLNGYDAGGRLKQLTLGGGQTVGNCTFSLYKYEVSDNEVYLMSRATGNGGMAAVEYHLVISNVSPYNNVIFSNTGLSGSIVGQLNLAGSVYSRGSIAAGGDVGFYNNYDDVDDGLGGLVGIIPNETDLDAYVRVTNGDFTLSGNATVGSSSSTGAYTGIYVDGDTNVDQGDNSWAEDYGNDVPNVPMPSLLDGLNSVFGTTAVSNCAAGLSGGTDAAIAASLYADWAESGGCFTKSTGVVIDSDVIIDNNATAFSVWDSYGNGIKFTPYSGWPTHSGEGELEIVGNVVINGDLVIDGNKVDGVQYSASGVAAAATLSDPTKGATLFVKGGVEVNGSFYPPDGYLKGEGAPNDINSLGVVAGGNITFDGKNSDFQTGFFFTEGTVYVEHQGKFGGTMIAGNVNFGQVPDVFQVPNLQNYLPPGVPGGYNVFQLTRREWRRVY